MELGKPVWEAKQIAHVADKVNPHFAIVLNVVCFVTLRCEETGDLFKNPKNLDEDMVNKYPSCGQEDAMAFETADSARILNAGFTKEDYE